MEQLTTEKREQWHKWGKEAYKNTASMMRNNSHHKDYQTLEQREAVHDKSTDESYLFGASHIQRLKTLGYTDESILEAKSAYKKGYESSRAWYRKADEKQRAVIAKYQPIFDEAQKIAESVDVSDIRDGFPCGSAHLYLQHYAEAEDLYKALGHFESSSLEAFRRELPIKFPSYGQCIAFDERICAKVNEFLRSKGIFASVYSWID